MAESLKNELIKRVNNFGGDKNYWDAQKKNVSMKVLLKD